MKAQVRLILQNQVECNLTTEHGGIPSTPWVHVPVQTPGGSSGLQSSTCMSNTRTERLGRDGEALLGGVIAENAPSVEGDFVTPRSEQGMPTIPEMVEGIPGARQLMSRVGNFFQRSQRYTSHHHEVQHVQRVVRMVS